MDKYNPQKIEKHWQRCWEQKKTFKTKEGGDKPKFYVLDMFPYLSGAGLHVGHLKGYIATDVVARMKMMQGSNVLHPIGWDAFGLPAENYALQHKIHPEAATTKNIAVFRKQLGLLGFTYDWDKEINTSDPKYYKWTQWIFLQLFKRGLAYESFEPINWCPGCQTGLANEDLEEGKCERCGSVIERRPIRQWVLKITAYAQRLLDDLSKLPEWEESIKEMQRNWIGRSEGASVRFIVIPAKAGIQRSGSPIKSRMTEKGSELDVFTTRPDTLFGATYLVISPEHSLISNIKYSILNIDEVERYIEKARHKSDLERTELQKEKTGVELKGIKAINPVNGEELPIFVADYVLMGYGTGAIMAVPAHDERDWEFAKKKDLPIIPVILPKTQSFSPDELKPYPEKLKNVEDDPLLKLAIDRILNEEAFCGEGFNINSSSNEINLNFLQTSEAKEKMIKWLEEKRVGKRQVQYKLRDWVFSRQRYWGEPIPLVKCEKCGWVPIPEKDLPLELPKVKSYAPTGTGESPLANIKEWVHTKCPHCGGPAKRETNTMPQWAGSCWYYLRYIDPKNDKALVDKKKEKYWSPVDLYVGGAEHATRHLIYARFWHKFLYDIGAVSRDEPFTRLQHVGLILAEDGRKMSKRWHNVINPDEVVKKYGADAMRLYEMFMGPFSQPCAWSTKGVVGMRRFLEKVWGMATRIDMRMSANEDANIKTGRRSQKHLRILHKTIKKVSEDIENFKFNTAISALMILVNEMSQQPTISNPDFTSGQYSIFLKLLSPFAPHLCEELWLRLGHKGSIAKEPWPSYDPSLAKDETITLAIQVNGKLRDTLEVPAEITEEEAKEKALASPKIQKWLAGKKIKKFIYIKGRLVNLVVE